MNSVIPFPAVRTSIAGSLQLLSVLALTLLAGCATQVAPQAPPAAVAKPPPTPAEAKAPPSPAPKTAAPVSNPVGGSTNGSQVLFDGKSLQGWAITDFAGHGEVKAEDGKLILEMGVMTGVTYTNPVPKMNYEIELDTMRVEGNDFFCGLTFPIGEHPCSLILGGWGGGVVGLSSIDGEDAAHNETSKFMNFDKGKWYHVRLRVTPAKIEAWVDKEKLVDLSTEDRNFSIRIEMELSKPLGLATWSTTGAFKDVRLKKL